MEINSMGYEEKISRKPDFFLSFYPMFFVRLSGKNENYVPITWRHVVYKMETVFPQTSWLPDCVQYSIQQPFKSVDQKLV